MRLDAAEPLEGAPPRGAAATAAAARRLGAAPRQVGAGAGAGGAGGEEGEVGLQAAPQPQEVVLHHALPVADRWVQRGGWLGAGRGLFLQGFGAHPPRLSVCKHAQ